MKLEEIYIKHHKKMFDIAYSILKNPDDAEDCVQESVFKIAKYIEKIDKIDSNYNINLFITIVKNLSLDLYRKTHKNHNVNFGEVEEMLIDDTESIENYIIRSDESERLYKKLMEIKEEYVEIITLKYFYDMDNHEIAYILSISDENARVRLHRAKSSIKRMLNQDSYLIELRKCSN